jgi:hypothetical protein
MNYLEESIKGYQQDNKALTKQLWSAKRAQGKYMAMALIGWSILVAVLAFPEAACASEKWSSIVIRCQQSNDTCIKKESVFYSEQDCDRENAKVVEAIGPTDDVVIAFCQSGK